MTPISLLGWTCLAAALGACGTYAYVVARAPSLVRLLNGLGLFLTGLALFQGPSILRAAGGDVNIALAMLILIVAAIAQAAAALRYRSAWDGADRRAPWDGNDRRDGEGEAAK